MLWAAIDAVNRLVVTNNKVYIIVGTKISNQSNAVLGIWPRVKIKTDKIEENHRPVLGLLKTSLSTLMKYPLLKSSSVIPPPITPNIINEIVESLNYENKMIRRW